MDFIEDDRVVEETVDEFVQNLLTELSNIPLTGHRKTMRALSAKYDDRLFLIKGIKNLLGTIFDDLYFLFNEANEEQKSKFITIIVNYYQEYQPNGLELRLCDGVARQFAVNDAFLVFEAMLVNPAKELYFQDIYLGLDVLYMHYKNDKVIMSKIESMIKRLV
ncbi:MAG: hypothetical protein ACRCXK_05250 [Wohlfahrtiimonas sp.]